MLLSKHTYNEILIVLCCVALISCSSNTDNKSTSGIDSSDIVVKDTVHIDSVLSDTSGYNFKKITGFIYNKDAKVALKFLLAGNHRYAVDSSYIYKRTDSIPDSLDRKKPFLIVTDIDIEHSLESVFNIRKQMYLQLASPGCLLDVKQIGAMEYAVTYSDTKVILVLANRNSRIVGAACDRVQTTNFTDITKALDKAINASSEFADRSSANKDFVNSVAQNQAMQSINYILKQSPKIKLLADSGKVILKSAFYNFTNRSVTLLNQNSPVVKPVTK